MDADAARTFRIPLIHDTPRASSDGATVAPYLEGQFSVQDEAWNIPFLLDTGADFSALNPNLLPGHHGPLLQRATNPRWTSGAWEAPGPPVFSRIAP